MEILKQKRIKTICCEYTLHTSSIYSASVLSLALIILKTLSLSLQKLKMDDGQVLLVEEMFPDDFSEDDEDDCVVGEEDVLDSHISNSSASGFEIGISEETANSLYCQAGTEEPEVLNETVVLPTPHMLTTTEEEMIRETAREISVAFLLDNFQVQSLVALLNNRNVVVIAPCGSGKLLIFQMAVNLLRKKHNLPNGVGICLQPLNNILFEKTNNNPPLKTAYLTLTGDAVKSENVHLSSSLEEILTGEIGCLLGHAESFVSSKGKYAKVLLSMVTQISIFMSKTKYSCQMSDKKLHKPEPTSKKRQH